MISFDNLKGRIRLEFNSMLISCMPLPMNQSVIDYFKFGTDFRAARIEY